MADAPGALPSNRPETRCTTCGGSSPRREPSWGSSRSRPTRPAHPGPALPAGCRRTWSSRSRPGRSHTRRTTERDGLPQRNTTCGTSPPSYSTAMLPMPKPSHWPGSGFEHRVVGSPHPTTSVTSFQVQCPTVQGLLIGVVAQPADEVHVVGRAVEHDVSQHVRGPAGGRRAGRPPGPRSTPPGRRRPGRRTARSPRRPRRFRA